VAAGLVKELMMEPLSGYWLPSQFPPLLMLMVSGTVISSDYFLMMWFRH